MAAAEIFKVKLAVVDDDLGVVAGDAAIAEDEIVVGRAADAEREGVEGGALAAAVGVDDDEGGAGAFGKIEGGGHRCVLV